MIQNSSVQIKSNNPKEVFDSIKQADNQTEYWSARDLQKILGYEKWENFHNTIKRAKKSFDTSQVGDNYNINYHFLKVRKMIKTGKGATREVDDYLLSRYACYLIAQNGDPSKQVIADAQAYFNIQTLRQENFEQMTEEERRLYVRKQVADEDKKLFNAAKESGVENYGSFYDAGYLGLYGMRNKEIVKKKGLGKDKLLDRAGATELAANLFRITQTKDKLQSKVDNGEVIGDKPAANTHYMVGSKVRQAIEEIGGTMPENLPPEDEHIKKLEKRLTKKQIASNNKKKIE